MNRLICLFFVISIAVSCTKDCECLKPECPDPECPDPDPKPDSVCTTDLTKGLLAYYPFNENFNDESGNANHATARNGAFLTTDFLGRANKSAGFDGINDLLVVPGSSKLNSDTITVAFQVMVNNSFRRNTTISRIDFETGQSMVFALHQSVPTDPRWYFSVVPGTDDCTKQYPYDTSVTNFSNPGIQAGRWYQIIVSFAGGVQKMYIDGVLHSTKTQTFSNPKKCDNADLLIGGWHQADIVSIDGKIDEVRLYNRVLSDCEIAKLSDVFKQSELVK